MKKIAALLFFGLFLFSSESLKAQKLFFVFVHGQYNSPANDNFSNVYKAGGGVEGGAGIGLLGKTFLVATVGTNKFSGINNNTAALNYTPIKGGIRQFIFLKRIFLQGNIGSATLKYNNTNESRIMGDIGIGAKLLGFEAVASYETIGSKNNSPSLQFISLKAGFNLGL